MNEKKIKLVSRALVIIIGLAMLLPVSAVIADEASAPVVNDSTEIWLEWADISFNTRSGVPDVPANYRVSGFEPGEIGTYLVQFKGPMDPSYKQSLVDLGAEVYDTMKGYAVTARMTPAVKAQVDRLDTVEWTGIYQPAYKISADLMNREGSVRMAVSVFDAENNIYPVAQQLSDMGATVMSISDTIEITTDPVLIPAIVAIDEVNFVDEAFEPQLMDVKAAEIHNIDDAWYTSWSGLPTSLTGTNMVIGVQDSGWDEGDPNAGSPDWFDSPNGDRVIDYIDQGGASDPDGNVAVGGAYVAHGTHVIGIIMSDGYCWETEYGESTTDKIWHNGQAGAAPEAELIAYGVTASGRTGGSLNPSITYWDDMQATDARAVTYSFSIGTSPGDYDGTYSNGHDSRTDTDNERLFFVAAGNEGNEPDTLNPYSQAKNGFCVGANQNYRPEWFQADNPNLVATFSSRGGTLSNTRIKPDMVAAGTSMISNYARGQATQDPTNPSEYGPPPDQYDWNIPGAGQDGKADYQYMQGTSMATPQLAGASLLVREYYQEIYSMTAVPAHLIKATMINGAVRMSDLYEYPGYDQGWGRLDLQQSLFPPTPRSNQWATGTMATAGSIWDAAVDGGMNTNVFSADVPLKVTLVWTDEAGVALDRNLDLRVTDPSGNLYKGNSYVIGGDGYTPFGTNVRANWDASGVAGYDGVNNVEQVEVEFPEAGAWTIEVYADTLPSNAPFALIFSADIGPQDAYKVEMTTDYPTTFSVVQNGQATFPFKVLNYGTNSDSIALTHNPPAGMTITYSPTSPLALASGESVDVVATISADATIAGGSYSFEITGTSQNDPNTPKAADILRLTVEVLTERLPTKIQLTNSSIDEYDPSVLTFNDGTTDWIFVTYLKTSLVGDARVRVMYTTLDANGNPNEPWIDDLEIPNPAGNAYEYPNDPRITVMPGGTYANRVFVHFTGYDPAITTNDNSAAWTSYADLGSYSSWTTQIIDINGGAELFNYKRVNFMLARASVNELVYGFETGDYDGDPDNGGNLISYSTHVCTSTDGGATWSAPTQVSPTGDGNYYFFPNGAVDQNDVVWVFLYWRTSTSNSRDILAYLYDGAWSAQVQVWDVGPDETADNLQWPSATSTAEGAAGNRVYMVCTRDEPVPYQLYTTYIDGDYTSASPPPDSVDGWGNGQGPFGSIVGNANYDRRPVTNIIGTDDGWTWVPFQERDTPYDAANLHTIYTNDAFVTTTTTKVTADAYAKGHEMVDSLTIGTTSNMYEVFHSNHGTSTEVNYDVYLIVYHEGWEADPDTVGPTSSQVAATPNPYDLSTDTSFDLTANINDVETGMSNIAAAEYVETATTVIDPAAVSWTGATAMSVGTDSAAETATATVVPSGWADGETHRFWVRGQDSVGNWGDGSYVDINVIQSGAAPTPITTGVSVSGLAIGDWIFISCNITATGDVTAVIDDATWGDGAEDWDIAYWYDTATGTWKTHNKNAAALGIAQTMPTFNNHLGVWLRISALGGGGDRILSMGDGYEPTSESISLVTGWNMVGYPATDDTTYTVGDLKTDTGATIVQGYGGAGPYDIVTLADTYVLQKGEAYWVKVGADTTWIVNW